MNCSCTSLIASTLLVGAGSMPVRAVQPSSAEAPAKTYLLVQPADGSQLELTEPEWDEIKDVAGYIAERVRKFIRVVDRSQVNPAWHVDVGGARLYCDSEATYRWYQESLPKLPRYFFRSLLHRARANSGVECEQVPVRGEEGKKMGTREMVLIEGGEYLRPGRYFSWRDEKVVQRGDPYRVQVSSFWIDRYKVTVADYCRFLNDGNAALASGADDGHQASRSRPAARGPRHRHRLPLREVGGVNVSAFARARACDDIAHLHDCTKGA